jgi:two-component system, sporulation sensor kinase E
MYKPFQNITIIVIAWITIATGVTVMAGWLFNIPILQTIIPGFIPMKFNPALCFVLFGSALLFTQYKKHRFSTPLFFILSILGTLIGTITLCQDLFHFNAGIDQLFITDKTPLIPNFMFPGRMAFNSSLSFMLLGFGLFAFNTKSRLLSIISQCLFQIVIVLTAIALIGYLYGSALLSTLFYVTTMAVHTAILFFILSLAASLLNPSIGITRLFTGKQVGNQMAKRLYTLMIVMVILVGAFRMQIQDQQLPQLSFKTAESLLAIGFLMISLLLIWNTANWLNKIDTQRSEAEEKIKQMNAGLEKIVEERSAEFQKSEEKYRSLIEQASDAIYILNFHGNFTDVNASMCRMIGYSREELLQLNIESIIDPYELKVDPLPKQMDNTKESIIRERRFRNKNGKVFTVEVNVKKFTDRIMVIARDITDRKKTEEELKSSEQKYRLLFDSNPMPMWMITKDDQNIIAVNDAAAFHYGYSKDELLNTHVKALRPVEDLEQQLEGYRTEVNQDIIRVVRHVKKDGTIMFVHIMSHDIIFEGRPVRLSMTNDITEKLNAEESLQKSEANLQAILKTTDTAYALFDKNLIKKPLNL